MNDINFLSLNSVIAAHKIIIERYGGSQGIRDKGLLESALAQPEMQLFGEYIYHDYLKWRQPIVFTSSKITRLLMEINGQDWQ